MEDLKLRLCVGRRNEWNVMNDCCLFVVIQRIPEGLGLAGRMSQFAARCKPLATMWRSRRSKTDMVVGSLNVGERGWGRW